MPAIKEKILLAETEKGLTALLTTFLSYHNYNIIHASTAQMAIQHAASCDFDLILLDLKLPDMSGTDALRRIREWSDTPIFIISEINDEKTIVDAFESEANDYILKPFGNEELLARIRSSIRIHRRGADSRSLSTFTNCKLCIDYEKHLVTIAEKPIHLTPVEYKILVLLSQNLCKVLTHEFLLSRLWGPFASESHILRVNIANIRKKIEENPSKPVYIITETGIGYRMNKL